MKGECYDVHKTGTSSHGLGGQLDVVVGGKDDCHIVFKKDKSKMSTTRTVKSKHFIHTCRLLLFSHFQRVSMLRPSYSRSPF